MTTPAFSHDTAHGIHAIDAHYNRPGVVAFYLLVENGQATFIDTGTARSLPRALTALNGLRLTPADVTYVIPTHVHLDHAGGAGVMMREFPNARLVIHPRGARHMIDPAKLIAGVTEVYGAEIVAQNFGEVPPVPVERVIEAPDNFTLDLNGRRLRFLDTPGHARHHFCVWDERSGSVFSGDTFGISYREFDTARGAFIFPAMTPVQLDPEALHQSIDRLAALKPRQIWLTHFGRVTEIERLTADMHELIDTYVTMARAVNATGQERHQRLIDEQRGILLPRLKQHGCKFDPDQIEKLIGGDFELNAQGLGVWLDHEASPR